MNIFNNNIYPVNRPFIAKKYKQCIGKFYLNPFTKEMVKKNILFIHIPKTGGTSVATALLSKPTGHPYLYEFVLANKNFANNFYKFCVVRNPFDRLVSAYSYISKGECNPEFKKIFKTLKIETFNDLIIRLDDRNSYTILTNYIVHLRTQYEMIYHDEIEMNRIFRFEDLDSLPKIIEEDLNLKINLQKLNSSKRAKLSYREYYNDRSRKVVERIYKEDLKLFDYQF